MLLGQSTWDSQAKCLPEEHIELIDAYKKSDWIKNSLIKSC